MTEGRIDRQLAQFRSSGQRIIDLTSCKQEINTLCPQVAKSLTGIVIAASLEQH